MSQRIKGQDLSMVFVVDGKPVATLGNFVNPEFEWMFRRLEEEYVGQTAKKFDEILDGVHLTTDLHVENQDVLTFLQQIIDRAARRNINLKINVHATLSFPNGDRPRIFLNDVFFDRMPFGFGSRSAYGTLRLDMTCSTARIVASA